MNKNIDSKTSNRKAAKTADSKKAKAEKTFVSTFYLDCESAVGTNLILLPDVEKYIIEKFKPKKGGRAGDLKGKVVVSSTKDGKIKVQACEAFPRSMSSTSQSASSARWSH
eukprot:gnl/Chilomastix_caulleri/2676.p1 GENE.gnl/Chilomastix_caulleri/2676~~gnl/Chilomastix_caulleri/2676.p1  ORF type:complete len:111 (-),score=39.97 gnl/Chilomastix_caulleri/2676:23-355(-)